MGIGIKERLRLLLAFGAGSRALLEYFTEEDSEECCYRLLHDDRLSRVPQAERFRSIPDRHIDRVIDDCNRNGIAIVAPDDDDFPEGLRHIEDSPVLLFALGDLSLVNTMPAVGIVGSRMTNGYYRTVADRYAAHLARECGADIVSGFAHGIDTAAHLGALDSGGATTAVLGCGILCDYPKKTMPLKRRIAEHGAVVSEYIPTAVPTKKSFKVRNRILTGMCDCIVVVQAGARSGALNSAFHAADQGREVFVVPPSDIFAEESMGQIALLNDGASLTTSPADIAAFLEDMYNR